jgi:hypothetical protein
VGAGKVRVTAKQRPAEVGLAWVHVALEPLLRRLDDALRERCAGEKVRAPEVRGTIEARPPEARLDMEGAAGERRPLREMGVVEQRWALEVAAEEMDRAHEPGVLEIHRAGEDVVGDDEGTDSAASEVQVAAADKDLVGCHVGHSREPTSLQISRREPRGTIVRRGLRGGPAATGSGSSGSRRRWTSTRSDHGRLGILSPRTAFENRVRLLA